MREGGTRDRESVLERKLLKLGSLRGDSIDSELSARATALSVEPLKYDRQL